VIFDIILCKKQ